MPVTATFEASFTQFRQAVDQATTKLKDFQTDANKVQSSLNRIGSSFSGQQIISQATLAAKAVTDIGGATKLTQSEQARLNATLTEAIAKYTALGQQAPQSMIDLQKVTQSAATTTQSIGTSAKSVLSSVSGLAGAFGIAFSVGAVVNFGRNVLAAGSAIQKMSDQTALTNTEVQQFQYIAGQADTNVESLVLSVQNLQQRLGDETTGAAGAMRKLRINADEFNQLSTHDQVLRLSDALRAETDVNARASEGAALFGKTWKEIAPAILSDMRALGDQAPIMSDAMVKASDEAGDALKRWEAKWITWGGAAVLAIDRVIQAQGEYTTFNAGPELANPVADTKALAGAIAAIPPATLPAILGLRDLGNSAAFLDLAEQHLTTQVKDHIDAANKAVVADKERGRALADAAALVRENINALGSDVDLVAGRIELSLDKAFDLYQLEAFKGELSSVALAFDDLGDAVATDLKRMNDEIDSAMKVAGAQGTVTGQNWYNGIKSATDRIPELMIQAFTGGGGALGAAKAFGVSLGTAIASSIQNKIGGVLGSLFSGGIGALVAGGIGALVNLIGGIGGPSNAELAGRSSTDAFAQQMAGMLTWQRQIEVHQLVAAGNSEKWAETILGVRDAYAAAGLSEAQADDVVNRLFASEKQGGTATQKIIDEIVLATNNFAKASTLAGEEGKQAYELIDRAATDAADATAKLADETKRAYTELLALRGFQSGGGGEGSSETRNASDILAGLSPASAEAAYLTVIAPGSTHQDWDRVKSQYGYAAGTGGFMNFGAGTPAILHGEEKVVTRAQDTEMKGLRAEVKGLREDMQRMMAALPYQLSSAVQLRH